MRFTTLVVAVAILALVGCSSGSADSGDGNREKARKEKRHKQREREAAKAEAPAQPEASPPAEEVVVASFVYDPTGKRDPFRSYQWERPDRPDKDLRGPLEEFDLNQLAVVAVVWATGNARALIQDPSGQSYIIGEGARVGKNEGKVVRIDDNMVVVKETYVDYMGERTMKNVELQIRRTEGG